MNKSYINKISFILLFLLCSAILSGCFTGYTVGYDLTYRAVSGTNHEWESMDNTRSVGAGGGAALVKVLDIITFPLFPVTFIFGSCTGMIGGLSYKPKMKYQTWTIPKTDSSCKNLDKK